MIHLARHGETTWNIEGRYQGRLESPLSPLGIRQGEALANSYAERIRRGERVPTRVISSPQSRCVETARFSARVLGLRVETDERIVEIGHGTWEGRLREEIAKNDPQRYRAWREDPAHVAFDGGECLADVDRRWREFAASLTGTPDDILIVTHDAVVRIALLAAEERAFGDFRKPKVENGAYARLEPNRDEWTMVEECVTRHLHDLRADVTGQAL
ncbi:MAG TPA: histidine phosphatase family protein [Candidatus Baltobacteraceae bacterium]|nr:histidine phosphatase family protein [Candidatus Baltobacteraceae bacterium]